MATGHSPFEQSVKFEHTCPGTQASPGPGEGEGEVSNSGLWSGTGTPAGEIKLATVTLTYLQARSTETARIHLRRLAKALRQARQADTGAYALVVTEPQRIIFYSDVDGDGLTERIRYELQGTDLERGVLIPTDQPLKYTEANEQTTIVASDVRNDTDAIFTYYTGDYPADPTPLTPTDLTEVKYIQFFLRIDADPAVDPPAVEVRSQVQLRNLKTNLGEEVQEVGEVEESEV